VQYGVSLPTGGECGDPGFLVELAERAEAVGWDGVFLEDYVCYGGEPAALAGDPGTSLVKLQESINSLGGG